MGTEYTHRHSQISHAIAAMIRDNIAMIYTRSVRNVHIPWVEVGGLVADGDLFEPVVTMETIEEGHDHHICTHMHT